MSKTSGQSRCAWCGADLGPRPDLPRDAVSHGICAACAALLEREGRDELRAAAVELLAGHVRTAAEALLHAAQDLARLAALLRS